MYRDVPHPTAATRAPSAGRTPSIASARRAPRPQHAGWVAISCSISLTWTDNRTQSLTRTMEAPILPAVRQSERLGVILEELSSNGSVAVADLSPRLNVSPATVRRG